MHTEVILCESGTKLPLTMTHDQKTCYRFRKLDLKIVILFIELIEHAKTNKQANRQKQHKIAPGPRNFQIRSGYKFQWSS